MAEWLLLCVRNPGRYRRCAGRRTAQCVSLVPPQRSANRSASRSIGRRPDYDRDVAVAQARLTPGEWEAGWAEGKAMTLEQAVAYALDETNPE